MSNKRHKPEEIVTKLRQVSCCCPDDGSWRGPSLGSAATDASPRTSKKPSKAPRPGC